MGAIADAFVAFSQPLLDATDGSMNQVQRAMSWGQFCYNLALVPEERRQEALADFQSAFGLDDEEYAELIRDVILP